MKLNQMVHYVSLWSDIILLYVKGSQEQTNHPSSTIYMDEICMYKTLLLCEPLLGGVGLKKMCFLKKGMGT